MGHQGGIKVKNRGIDRKVGRSFPGGGGLIAVLDAGSSKVACMIGQVDPSGGIRLAGMGLTASHGIRAGTVVDMARTREAVGRAIHEAEVATGSHVESVIVNISGGHPLSHTYTAHVDIGSRAVSENDLRRAIAQARPAQEQVKMEIVHSLPVEYAIDGNRGVRDPLGMEADQLAMKLHVVSAEAAALNNLRSCVEECHLAVERFVVSPYASGLAVLLEDERQLGTAVIDMGSGTTTVAVFVEGRCIWVDSLPVGGWHVTSDIARGLGTTLADAERLKTLHGHAMTSAIHYHEEIDVPVVGDNDETHMRHLPKSMLGQIIQPRLEETFELVRSRLEASGMFALAGHIVLTGGASQMPGIRDLAHYILDRQIRHGRPSRLISGGIGNAGAIDPAANPSLATCAGLLAFAGEHPAELPLLPTEGLNQPSGLFGRVGQWLRENL